MSAWIIAYDIASPRRLAKIYRRMCAHATPLEYSVFLLIGTARAKSACLAEVGALIDARSDDVRCYALPVRGLQARIGRATLPGGNHWTGLPSLLG